MNDQRRTGPEAGAPRGVEEILTAALATPPLDAPALARVRAQVAQEWSAANAAARQRTGRRPRWWGVALAACGSAAIVAVTLMLTIPRPEESALGTLVRAGSGGIEIRSGPFLRRTLQVGGTIRAGDRVTAAGPVLVMLTGGGTLRIAPGSELTVLASARLAFDRGLLYVDIPPHSRDASSALRVETPAGVIEHVGTEFEVMRAADVVRVRVREGEIRLDGPGGTRMARAGTQLLAVRGQPVLEQPVATYGRDWMWAAALAPDYEIEGRTLMDFLQWVSREAGCPLDFADPQAREVATRTVLHGSIRDQAPMDALANVLATTTLAYQLANGRIRVHSGP
jgi:ferric-dicitrate binding protein FerR (iron transport regulator)